MAYRVRSVLNGLLAANRRMRYEIACRRAVETWERVIDPYTSLHTRAVRVKEGRLLVHTDNPILANELSLQEEQVRARLNERLGSEVIERLVFRAGRIPQQPERKQGPGPGEKLSSGDVQRIERTVQGVSDPDLRDSMKKLLRTMALRTRRPSK